MRLGVPHDQFLSMMEPDVGAAMQDALGVLKQQGATLVDVRFPPLDAGRRRAPGDHLQRSGGRPRRADPHTGRRACPTRSVRSCNPGYSSPRPSTWPPSKCARTRSPPIANCGGRSTCWSRRPARSRLRLIGATTARLGDKDIPLVRAFLDLTLPFNLTGQPALSVPCGFTRAGLPIGLQLVGRPFDEATLFRAGAAYEAATDWHSRKPPIVAGDK